VPARLGRHEADAEKPAVIRVAEAIDLESRAAFICEFARERHVGERVSAWRIDNVDLNLDELIVSMAVAEG
jgi:hypothetical protein